ncbi:MAG: RAMP superfamily CRISPR-associated protein [Candidatus Poribacteria bacterium]|nr:RAMP superfamily CRISPR-associated protein [Candidatus Poribacteria bacterium]
MHKRIVNEAIIKLDISPAGPVLIKASDQGGDPTKPDMEFVVTYHNKGRIVYLPGSSLKGAIRAHCERIVRTIGGSQPKENHVWACNPLDNRSPCRELNNRLKNDKNRTASIYRESCTICQLFGSTDLGAHARIADAYPTHPDELQLEERNGVAIDRVLGSVAVGPFNFEVLTNGTFETRITVKNFTTPQLALLALVIRDFDEHRVGIGFAKSRGLGQVNMKVKSVTIRYPTAICENEQLRVLGRSGEGFSTNRVIGAGALVDASERYGFPTDDTIEVAVNATEDDWGFGATMTFDTPGTIDGLWRNCVASWRAWVQGEGA